VKFQFHEEIEYRGNFEFVGGIIMCGMTTDL